MAIALTIYEITTGATIDKAIFEAQTILNERVRAQAIFIGHLRSVHGAPEGQYDLVDWFQGFTEVAQPAPPPVEPPVDPPADPPSKWDHDDLDHSENDE